jgi:hypothetical protein
VAEKSADLIKGTSTQQSAVSRIDRTESVVH